MLALHLDFTRRIVVAADQQQTCVAHKFGGSSLKTAERIAHVAGLLRGRTEPTQITVVSAMGGVTDALIGLVHAASRDPDQAQAELDALAARHREAARGLLGDAAEAALAPLERDWQDLRALLRAVALLGHPATDLLEYVQGLGEVWSAQLLAARLRVEGERVDWLDARAVLVISPSALGAVVDWVESGRRLAAWRATHSAPRVVVTGFVARDSEGRITTLGRNGSDYSGAIFARLFAAAELHIWTDVDGVLSADPRLVPEAILLPRMSYDEAFELAYFGAKVVHPRTMGPVLEAGIPVWVRNTFKPDCPGTRIGPEHEDGAGPVKGLTIAREMALVEVEGTGMIGVPGTAERVFGALRDAGVSVVMIAQASSEHSICCVVREADAARAAEVLRRAFARELDAGLLQAVDVERGIAVLAAVGDGMSGHTGIAARLFSELARAEVNVRAIAQGGTERNISVAVRDADAARALRAVHAGFYLSPQTVSIGVIGPGNVGATLLDQLAAVAPKLREQNNLDLRVRAIAGSQRWLHSDSGLDLADWRAQYAASSEHFDFEHFTQHVRAPHLPHALIIDCSASATVAAHYPRWLAAGIHIITPNKQAGAAPLELYRRVREAARHGHWRYEATVGAGLPVISTLRDLLDTGDEVHAIDGILSGTLSYLFNAYDGSRPFSELLLEARQLGYTEPDPRDDLSGLDVARKLVILSREWGHEIELADVDLVGLVPPELSEIDREAFLARAGELDAPMLQRFQAAQARGCVLRFVAHVDAERATVGLVELPRDHAFAHLKPTDNIIQFSTARYSGNPLIVQGPGAGPEVTAAGVFADLLRVAQGLGTRL
ncbi:bifunctional aspartate kinase/homoserine dehydrogenase I [Aquimonas voraii]|uniref:bifunctional aspartate kinase/homoserine dehydrogenase I n=1 Tax=Aquimonas voraii TaxID=265719 RepID=UPI000B806CDA|nr:bifunctional aspartate kinase/homoserine dehydrogenase I [Aquimonas voraii]